MNSTDSKTGGVTHIMRMGSQMLATAAAVALGWRTALSPDLMLSLNIQMDTPKNCI